MVPRLGSSAALLAFGITALVCGALVWPLPLHLGSWHAQSAFGDSHVWVWDHLWAALVEGEDLEPTCESGYPYLRGFRAIGLGPGAVALLLRPLLGPLGAANLVQLLSLPASALVAAVLVRRWTGAAPVASALLGATYALCPNLLATFATMEISNTQAWIPPALLLALGVTGWRGLAAVGAVGLLAAFSSPYLALSLPLLAGGWALWRLWSGRARPAAAVTRVLLVLGVLLASLLPARGYYQLGAASGEASLFEPAKRSARSGDLLPQPPPVAELDRLFLGTRQAPGTPMEPGHVVTLGLGLVVAVVIVGLWRRRLHPAGAAVALLGLVLALGPQLAVGGSTVVAGLHLPLPVSLLETLGYPTALGGMYYRYSAILVLGLVVVVGGGLAGWRRGGLAAALLLGVQLVHGVVDTGPFWPRPVGPVVGARVLGELRGRDGAVLELPLQRKGITTLGQEALLRAVFHGRPTTALPRDTLASATVLRTVLDGVESDPIASTKSLRALGFRYILLPMEHVELSEPGPEVLREALGEPLHAGEVLVWDLGPAELQCRPLKEKGQRRRSGRR